MCSFLSPSRLPPASLSLTAVRGRSSTKNVSYPRPFPTITFVRSTNLSHVNWMVGALNVYIKLGLVRVRILCVCMWTCVLYVLLNNILTYIVLTFYYIYLHVLNNRSWFLLSWMLPPWPTRLDMSYPSSTLQPWQVNAIPRRRTEFLSDKWAISPPS